MTFSDFETTTYGKWILAGEHAVIRGHSALVFPILEKYFHLSYQNSTSSLSADYSGDSGADMHLLFWSVLEQGMQILGRSLNALNGHFKLNSNIPVGVGMGASAALCVAMARWFAAQNMINELAISTFARELENLFHGKSSGLDIAGVSAETGIFFHEGVLSPVQRSWDPHWCLSSCGQIGITSHCIQQVQIIWDNNPSVGAALDQKMQFCVSQAKDALEMNSDQSLPTLAKAMNEACACFEAWGLVSDSLRQHMLKLKEAGAIAVKPTGSGGGGNVISLWESTENIPPGLIHL
ncbi:mevalonate kinase (plasmid) [Legionella adelaidensis]|uniref:Mevalonate kinase n=1 Tax=Legionella adelaidensis TaxID=45056 RepID=A0A0W0R0B3_9GAMM|nr:mevalonate kinase [Legionella adelaidensis]KTC64485.1 mevalonate kinase [Legionella adelaidensis]VEH85853.1 mevalonate kinase [Legionella adelaidensis]